MNFVPMNPVYDDGRPMMQGYPPIMLTDGFGIFQCCKAPEAALAYIDWVMATVDHYVMAKFGLEGLQYEIKNDAITPIAKNEGSYVDILGELTLYPDMGKSIEKQWRGPRNDFMMAYDFKNTKFVYPLSQTVSYDLSSLERCMPIFIRYSRKDIRA